MKKKTNDKLKIKLYWVSRNIFTIGAVLSILYVIYSTLKHMASISVFHYYASFVSVSIMIIGFVAMISIQYKPDVKIIMINRKSNSKEIKKKNKHNAMIFE